MKQLYNYKKISYFYNITFGFFELGGLQSLQIKSSSSETCSGFSPIHVKCNQSSQPSH